MKYKPWTDEHSDCWDDSDGNAIKELESFLSLNSHVLPKYIRKELWHHIQKEEKANEDKFISYHIDEESDNLDSIPKATEDELLMHNGGAPHQLMDRQFDDIDLTDIQWDKEHDWFSDGSDFDPDELLEKFEKFKSSEVEVNRRKVEYESLHEHQWLARDAALMTFVLLESRQLVTDGGVGIGRLQLLIGAGGYGKSQTIDSIITSIESLGYTDEHYSVFATTGKAATNIGGSTFQNYSNGMGFNSSKFIPLGKQTLSRFQKQWKHKRLVIIDEFSMLGQADLHFIDHQLREIKGNELHFGGLTIILSGDPAQLAPVKASFLWEKNAKAATPNFYG